MEYLTPRPPGSQEGNVQIIGGDEPELRRFLLHSWSNMSDIRGKTAIYIGQLSPEHAATQIPVPEGYQVIGSIDSENGEHEVWLETSASTEEALEFCEETVLKAGWKFIEEWLGGPAGFVDSERPTPRTYCREPANIVLSVRVSRGPTMTAIWLSTRPQADPCASRMFPGQSVMYQILPSLQTPPNAKLSKNRSGSGGSNKGTASYSSSASLKTEMPFRDVVQAYDEQLTAIGWKPLNKNHDEKSAMSTWQFSKNDSLWSAYFSIAANPAQNDEYLLRLQIDEQAT